MVSNITTVLQRFTGEWALLLQPEAILAVCREIGYTGWRDRVLTPVTTLQLFLLQILHGNTCGPQKFYPCNIPPRRHQFVLPTLPLELGPTRFWTRAFPAATIVRDDKPQPQRSALAMMRFPRLIPHLTRLTRTLSTRVVDGLRYLLLCLRPSPTLAAENLFLRKQLALYRERGIKPRRITPATRLTLVWLAHWFDWRQALTVVQPATFIRGHCQGFRLFWRWTSRPGRPPLPADLRLLIRRMARDNPSWGEERIANELLLTLGLWVSPRTVRQYLPKRLDHGWHRRVPSQRWRTFVRNGNVLI
jgi:hypothetical protein